MTLIARRNRRGRHGLQRTFSQSGSRGAPLSFRDKTLRDAQLLNDPLFGHRPFQPRGVWPTSKLFLLFPAVSPLILSFPPVFRTRENSASPLNNGRTLTIFAAVYQDLDPNWSLRERAAPSHNLSLPCSLLSLVFRTDDENLSVSYINKKLSERDRP